MRNLFGKADKDSALARTAHDKRPRSALEAKEVARTNDSAPSGRNLGSGIPARAASAPAPARSRLSVIGAGLSFKGTLSADEDLLIQGRVEGSIDHHGTELTIGPNGLIEADISARRIIVQGTVHGDLHASELVILEASARVRGSIYAPSLGIRDGARFEGSIDMDSSETGPASRAKADVNGSKARVSEGSGALGENEVDRLLDRTAS